MKIESNFGIFVNFGARARAFRVYACRMAAGRGLDRGSTRARCFEFVRQDLNLHFRFFRFRVDFFGSGQKFSTQPSFAIFAGEKITPRTGLRCLCPSGKVLEIQSSLTWN